MKKTYQKPMVMIEDFTVSEMIAAASGGCGAIVTLVQQGCESTNNEFINDAFDIGHFTDACDLPITGDEYEGICLHGPAGNAIYTS